MVDELLEGLELPPEFTEILRRRKCADGTEPEERSVLCGIDWERYLALDKALGDDRPGPRFYYLEGELEIMTTSSEHERIKKWMADLLAIHFMEKGMEIVPRGQATMRSRMKRAGAEPDESWCIGDEGEWPDLVLEIALTSGGVRKLELYRQFEVPEVWIWSRERLEVFALRGDRSGYDLEKCSRLLPDLDLELLERCVGIRSWLEACRTFRSEYEGSG